MQEKVILQIDRAALGLIQALDANQNDLEDYLDADDLRHLQADLARLRQTLLGLEYGVLYDRDWACSPEELENVICEASKEKIPVDEAAAHVAEILDKHHSQDE